MTGEFLVKSGGSPSNQEYSDFTRLDSGFFRGTTSQCAQKMCMVSSHVQRWILRRLSHKRLQNLKQAKDEGLITSPEYSSRREAALQPSDPERCAKRPLDLDACDKRPNTNGSGDSRKPWELVQYFPNKDDARKYITSLKMKYTHQYGVRNGAVYSCKSHVECQQAPVSSTRAE